MALYRAFWEQCTAPRQSRDLPPCGPGRLTASPNAFAWTRTDTAQRSERELGVIEEVFRRSGQFIIGLRASFAHARPLACKDFRIGFNFIRQSGTRFGKSEIVLVRSSQKSFCVGSIGQFEGGTMATNIDTAPTEEKKVRAEATKDFFVKMITRDISLRDCIFDLLDNAIDGAHRQPSAEPAVFRGRRVSIDFDAEHFQIADNCGGITLHDAINHAFNFGKRPDTPSDVKGGIGLYGIGMKRAIFKIGRYCEVQSKADDATFKVLIDVNAWETSPDWSFSYEDLHLEGQSGTQLQVTQLNDGAIELFADPGFKNELIKSIARDYAFFIGKGLSIAVGGEEVPSYKYELLESDTISPSYETYTDDGVQVKIYAGLVDKLPDDVPEDLRPEMVERFGWFVICNDRVVLAADKTDKTVWGADDFNVWHGQYNGFGGFVFFYCDDQRKLPWTTTKRELDGSSPLYRRTIARMKIVTKTFIDYSNRRKLDLEQAQIMELAPRSVEVASISAPRLLRFPEFKAASVRKSEVTIAYQKPKRDIEEIKSHLGNVAMSAKDVGKYTFDYFRKVELGK
jgi:hypothetical protein